MKKNIQEIISLKKNNNEYWKYFILLGIIFLILEFLILKNLHDMSMFLIKNAIIIDPILITKILRKTY